MQWETLPLFKIQKKSKYPIKYVLKKSFKIDDHDKTTMLSTTKVTIT